MNTLAIDHPAVRPTRTQLGDWTAWTVMAKWGGLLFIFLIYFPLAWLALMSISERPLSGIPLPLTMDNYRALVDDTRWVAPFSISLLIAVFVGIVSAIAATLVGRHLPNAKRSGLKLLLCVIPLFVPGMSMGAALFIVFRAMLGLKLGYWSIIAGHFIWAFPFGLLVVLVLTSRFDHRLVEAAEDLGASKLRTFLDIELPILRPGIVGAGLFGFLLSFNEVLRTMFLRGTSTTMPIYNWTMAASQQSQVPIIFALATIILLVTLPLLAGVFWVLYARIDKS
ncbi:Spermidine Putrescine ABC transporter permease component potC (TC_3.A.1.11.1) [Mesorhizobium ventifaucium]|uniref:Spermidine Putrescine ABC transporter permease component potC (TC_3.A.1.11.1) n=2 Tax=Mesorhizobium ventifaucium TaxID=666020 RepID=A0ABN8JGX2_9HYPH|nr:Spermidine Putrescine ABC transporter permease component potC (TC_3.A.1.11.1) [Mesorhizobium ventifaucium]